MAFRDDLEASHARAEALGKRVAELEAENRGLRGELAAPGAAAPGAIAPGAAAPGAIAPGAAAPPIALSRPPPTVPLVLALTAAAGFAAAVLLQDQSIVMIAVGIVAVQLAITGMVLSRVLFIAGPGVAAVISGRRSIGADGEVRGFRVVIGRRFVVIPVLETVDALDLRPRTIEPSVTNAYVKDNVAVAATFRARTRVASLEPLIGRAVERFLGRTTAEVDRVAVETLEGAIRHVFADLTLDEIRHDAARLASEVIREAEHEMAKLGLELDDLDLVSVERS